jgi:4a-hydroxytetrahydrobiopterin dehydratase
MSAMQGPGLAAGGKLSRREISAAVSDWGWRLVLGTLVTQVPAGSLAEAADLAARLTAFLGGVADGRLWPDPRSGRLLLTVRPTGGTMVTGEEVELAHRISAFVRTLGLATAARVTEDHVIEGAAHADATQTSATQTDASEVSTSEAATGAKASATDVGAIGAEANATTTEVGTQAGTAPTGAAQASEAGTDAEASATAGGAEDRATGAGRGGGRGLQGLEIAIDALDIAAVRPFWQAVLGYTDEPGEPDAAGGLVDPLGQGPTIWFQQMDAPRPQRNRIHFDVSVPHDEARRRIGAALAAGGRLASDADAPACWVLADAEGNEACVCTWEGRDA